MRDWLGHNLLGLILLTVAPISIFIGSKFNMEKLVEFGVGCGSAAFILFRTPTDQKAGV